MKKLILISLFLMGILALNANAEMNCTMNYPPANHYDTGDMVLNVTGEWEGTLGNMTNVTWTIGTTVFSNTSVNGTFTTVGKGDFTYTVASADVSAGSLTAYATCYNVSNATGTHSALNSSSITIVIDKTAPSVTLNRPNNGQQIGVSDGMVTFEYTPTDTYLANTTLYLGGKKIKQSTTGTTTPNATSGAVSYFYQPFSADNQSLTYIVEGRDLAGNTGNSSTFTISVIYYGGAPLITDGAGNIISGGEYITPGQSPLSISGTSSFGNMAMGFLANWWWLIIIGAVIGLIIYNNRKKK